MEASIWYMKGEAKELKKKDIYIDKKKCETESSRNGQMWKRKAEINEKVKCRKFGQMAKTEVLHNERQDWRLKKGNQ